MLLEREGVTVDKALLIDEEDCFAVWRWRSDHRATTPLPAILIAIEATSVKSVKNRVRV